MKKKVHNVFLFFVLATTHVDNAHDSNEQQRAGNIPQPATPAETNAEILKQTAAVVMNGINMINNVDSPELVLPSLANMFAGMLNVAYLASRRSGLENPSVEQVMENLKEYLKTEEGKKALKALQQDLEIQHKKTVHSALIA